MSPSTWWGVAFPPSPPSFDYSYRNQGNVVSEFVSVLGLSNVVLVGHSSGTVVAAAAAAASRANTSDTKQPPPVVATVFVASALFHAKSRLFSVRWLKPFFSWTLVKTMGNRRKGLESMHLPSNAHRVLTDDFVEKFVAPTRLPNFYGALVETVMAKEAPYEELFDELLAQSTTTNSIPMLFVWGKDETYKPLPEKQQASIQRKLDAIDTESEQDQKYKVEVARLEDCHHYAQHEQPEALANEILGFLERNVAL